MGCLGFRMGGQCLKGPYATNMVSKLCSCHAGLDMVPGFRKKLHVFFGKAPVIHQALTLKLHTE